MPVADCTAQSPCSPLANIHITHTQSPPDLSIHDAARRLLALTPDRTVSLAAYPCEACTNIPGYTSHDAVHHRPHHAHSFLIAHSGSTRRRPTRRARVASCRGPSRPCVSLPFSPQCCHSALSRSSSCVPPHTLKRTLRLPTETLCPETGATPLSCCTVGFDICRGLGGVEAGREGVARSG